uniref:Uncharacterized protein n=1 Tax=Rhizophora mucronata TaxID=61149 RepID=A0A2P2JU61_RHIMU
MANASNPSGTAKAAQPQPQPQTQPQPSLSPYTIHQLCQSQSSNSSILYPVASSGRGFNSRPVHRGGGGGVALSSSNNSNNSLAPSPSYSYRPVAAASAVTAVATTATIDSHMHPHLLTASYLARQHPSQHYPPLLPSAPNPIKGFPVTTQPLYKVTPSPASDSNGYKSARSRDDTLVVVRDRKVRDLSSCLRSSTFSTFSTFSFLRLLYVFGVIH